MKVILKSGRENFLIHFLLRMLRKKIFYHQRFCTLL